MNYTEQQWEKLIKTHEGLNKILNEKRKYAELKGVSNNEIGVRFIKGKSQFYVKPKHHIKESMNFD